jgi:hypothetical protein
MKAAGQIIVKFNGNAVPEVEITGEVHARQINHLDRFIRRAYRVHTMQVNKSLEAAKQEKARLAPKKKEPEVTHDPLAPSKPKPPTPIVLPEVEQDEVVNKFKPAVGDVVVDKKESEKKNGKDDERGNAGTPEGRGIRKPDEGDKGSE